jgi:hypothetical protein
LQLNKKIITMLLTAVLMFALSAGSALAGDFDVNTKYYSKSLDNGYRVTAIISPFADKNYGLSYVENVYLLVTLNGQTYERVYFADKDLTANNSSAQATIDLTQSGSYGFAICMGNDNYKIGKTIINGQQVDATHSLTISSVEALNPFSDVKNNAWYTDYICTAYALGLINGMTATTYGPNESMTIAQAVVLATRINQLTTTGTTEDYSDYPGKWYKPYFDYAVSKGFLDKSYEAKWNQKATRSQFADIFAGCLPNEYLSDIHGYKDGFIPDVKMSDTHGADIYKLYNAGILQGSDEKYSFKPNTNIKRSEIAAIVVRMVMEEERIGYVPDENDEDL